MHHQGEPTRPGRGVFRPTSAGRLPGRNSKPTRNGAPDLSVGAAGKDHVGHDGGRGVQMQNPIGVHDQGAFT